MDGQRGEKPVKRVCMGILAHVDAGKTTFSEELLYVAGALRTPGKVDQGSTVMDGDAIEKQRGITIYADQGFFQYKDNVYYLIDTPGHGDFSPETERAMMAMDYAVLLLDGSRELPAHGVTLFQMLERRQIPVFFFINKMDLEGADLERMLGQIRSRLTGDVLFLEQGKLDLEGSTGEFLGERDEAMLEAYLGDGIPREQGLSLLRKMVRDRQAFPAMAGSALNQKDVEGFLAMLDQLTWTEYDADQPLKALAYRVRRDEKGRRMVFLKILQGSLKARDELCWAREENKDPKKDKVNELLLCQGSRYFPRAEVQAGDLAAALGLDHFSCGQTAGLDFWEEEPREFQMTPSMESRIRPSDGTDVHSLISALKILEDEEPQLKISRRRLPDGQEQVCAGIMGRIQLEVLLQKLKDRFQIQAEALAPQVLYQETIRKPVMGYGHYEPLRHYAEVNLLLEPAPRGQGITFESRCHVDVLAVNYQRLIRHWVLATPHRGVLTGSPLTDVHVVLINGRSHLKHTEGGDFREAVRRAVRQGLEKADNCLLEPWYSFEITAPDGCLGRILSDITQRGGECAAPQIQGDWVWIQGRGPVSAFMDYSQELAGLSRGRAGIAFVGTEFCPCRNQDEIVQAIGYDRGADTDHPSSSVFCSHGAGFTVNWDQAEQYMHCLKT